MNDCVCRKVDDAINLNVKKVKIINKPDKGTLHKFFSIEGFGIGLSANVYKAFIQTVVLIFTAYVFSGLLITFQDFTNFKLPKEEFVITYLFKNSWIVFSTLFFFHMSNYYNKWRYLADLYNSLVMEKNITIQKNIEYNLLHDILTLNMQAHSSFRYTFNKFLLDHELIDAKIDDEIDYTKVIRKIYEKIFELESEMAEINEKASDIPEPKITIVFKVTAQVDDTPPQNPFEDPPKI